MFFSRTCFLVVIYALLVVTFISPCCRCVHGKMLEKHIEQLSYDMSCDNRIVTLREYVNALETICGSGNVICKYTPAAGRGSSPLVLTSEDNLRVVTVESTLGHARDGGSGESEKIRVFAAVMTDFDGGGVEEPAEGLVLGTRRLYQLDRYVVCRLLLLPKRNVRGGWLYEFSKGIESVERNTRVIPNAEN